jgi:hypothetical protein
MNCHKLDKAKSRVVFDRFTYLHPEGRKLISGWFERAWQAQGATGEDCFEPFIFAWFAMNGWAACITEKDNDKAYLDALMRDPTICGDFLRLLSASETLFASSASAFARLWPIFEVKSLRKLGLVGVQTGARDAVINRHLAAGATVFEPECWKEHKDAGEPVPLDWPHTLAALYRVRCNLFHGEKAAHSEMDQLVVSSAFRTLVHFFRATGYL